MVPTQAHALVHGNEADIYADAGCQGVAKREEVQDIEASWHIAMRPGKRRALDKQSPLGAILDKIEQLKASIRAKVEHPFLVIKRQFGHTKARYRGLHLAHAPGVPVWIKGLLVHSRIVASTVGVAHVSVEL